MQEMIKQIVKEEMYRSYKQYYFIAGLPRSGSSLISAILNQNPKFYAGPNSPVLHLMTQMEQSLSQDAFFNAYPKPGQAALIIGSIINNWYRDVEQNVIFDKNSFWLNHIPYINGYIDQKPKIICPVRNVEEILASYMDMINRTQLISTEGKLNMFDDILVKNNLPITNDNRCMLLANNGVFGQVFTSLKNAYERGEDEHLHIVEYENLISDPKGTIEKIYEFIEQPYYEGHKFTDISTDIKEKDAEVYGFSDMHEVRSTIAKRNINIEELLSEQIRTLCQNQEFWRVSKETSEETEENFDINNKDDETTETNLI